MIRSEDVIRYFDSLAPGWDAGIIRNEEVIAAILDNAKVTEGKDILDVGCGTGVLIPDYLKRNVSSVTAIDISPRMAGIARARFSGPKVSVICGDAETADPGKLFDCIVVYNAFPHFPHPEQLVRHLSGLLRPGGTLTVAHGMSREKINGRHHNVPEQVSTGLMPVEELAEIFGRYLEVTTLISDDRMYQAAGTKKNKK